MKIGVLGEFQFRECRNAAEAAFIIATQDVELAAVTVDGTVTDAPLEWVASVAAISATAEFKAAVASHKSAVAAEEARAAAHSAARAAANRDYMTIAGRAKGALQGKHHQLVAELAQQYADAQQHHGNVVQHGYVAEVIAALQSLAPATFVVDTAAIVAAVRGGANTNAAIAAAVGAKTSDEEMAVSRRVASLVFKKALKQDRTGRISAP